MGVPAGYDADLTDVRSRDGVQARGPATSVSGLRVGRVGVLAAALGIGAAMFAIPGLAAADTGGSGGASGSVSSAGSLSSGSRGPVHASTRTARQSSIPADGVPGASAAEAVAGRDVGTGRQTSASKGLPNSIASEAEPEAEPRRGARSVGQSAFGGAASRSVKRTNNASPVEVPPAAVATTRSATTTASTATVPAVSAAAVPQVSAGNAGAAAVARVGWAPAVVAATSASPVPFAGLPANGLIAQLVQRIDAQNQATVRTIFHALMNWTSTLPVNPLTTWLEGGLLIVRKSLFNQTAGVRSVQSANSPTLVIGKIDVIDPEGDAWKVELVSDPSHGTVELGTTSQANGIGSTKYTYTPGEGYSGDDRFVVKVTPTEKVVNILHPFGVLNTRYYTVAVGDAAEAAKSRFNAEGADPKDAPETHLFLSNATVTVTKRGLFSPRYGVKVTLAADTAAKSFAWMDTRGNAGSIPVDTMLGQDWKAYSEKASENGGQPFLTFKYSEQGVEKAVFFDVRAVTKNADGSYTIAGDLKDGAPAQEGRVDTWDFVGRKFKAAYDNFLSAAGLSDCKSGQTCTTFSTVGTLGTTTLTAATFAQVGGRDYPLADPLGASANQVSPGQTGPGTIGVGEGNGNLFFGSTGYQPLELTAMVPWGTDGSFIAATNMTQAAGQGEGNGIFLFSAQAPKGGEPRWTKTPLMGNAWNAGVNVMTPFDLVLTDSTGNPIPLSFTGTPVIGTNTALKLAVTTDVEPSSLIGQAIIGQGIAAGTTISGFISKDVTGIVYSVSNPIVPTTYTGTPVAGTGPSLTAAQTNNVEFAVANGVDPNSLIGKTITGKGIATTTVITGVVSSDSTGVTYSLNNPIATTTSSVAVTMPIAVTLPSKVTTQPGLVVGLTDGSVYFWNGNACSSSDTNCGWSSEVGASVNGVGVTVIQNINSPVSMAIAPNGNVYALGDDLRVIDSGTNTLIETIGIVRPGPVPQIVVSPDGLFAYATAYLGNDTAGLAVIDTTKNTVLTLMALPQYTNADAVAISPDSTYGYIASGSTGSVYRFDTSADPATNPLVLGTVVALPGATPDPGFAGLAFSPDGANLYASYAEAGNVYVIDTENNTVEQTISVGGRPGAIAVSPDGSTLIVAQTPNFDSNVVSVISTSTYDVSYVTVGNGPAGVAFNPNPGLQYAYVTNSNDSTVSVIDTQTMTVATSFATGAGGDDTLGIAVTPDGINVYLANYDGGGDDYGTVPVFQVATAVPQGWAELQAPGGWDNDVAVNNIVALPNYNGFAVGLSNGRVATWNNYILADGTIVPPTADANSGCSNGSPGDCWTSYSSNLTEVNAIMPSGQNGGFVAIGANGSTGWAQGFNGSVTFGGPGQSFGSELPTTLMPYDGTTLVGSIGSAPVIAENGVISAPSYVSNLPDLSASAAGCSGTFNSGSGAGCAGYVLTVQQAAGTPIRVGQSLYGGSGLTSGTVIAQQISDGAGNLCANSCNAGSTGVYLVNTSQLVAPGTPMSASDGSGFMVGTSSGSVFGWNNDIAVLTPPNTWYSAENTMIPWRDGFVVGLDNGAIMYWSPSNNPAGSPPYVPLNGISMALNYPGSTIPSQLPQPPGWSQLVGYDPNCGCFPLGEQAVTSMVQMGDGFAYGLTSPDDSSNGAVFMYTGFGASSTSSAFGYLQSTTATTNTSTGQTTTTTTLKPLTPVNDLTIIASDSALPGPPGAVGSIQQMVPISQTVKDAAGNRWNASSLVVGLTDNGIYSWNGSNLPPAAYPSETTWSPATTWKEQQAPAPLPGQLNPDTLQAAWTYAAKATAGTTFGGTATAVGGSGDPIFGQPFNQPYCGSTCDGDFQTFVLNYPFGDKGVIYTYGDTLQANVNLSAAGYGYVFVPSGIWDKFVPDDYAAGLVLGVQGGPSLLLNIPDWQSGPVTDTITKSFSYTDTQETEFGVFSETIGLDASLTGSIGIQSKPENPLTLAQALYTPGLLVTWNSAGNPDSLGISASAFSTTGYVSTTDIENYFDVTGSADLSVTVTPYASVSYGLYTPPSFIFPLDVFKLSVGFQNPITADLTIPLADPDKTKLSLTSQGFLTASAAFIPGITSDLSWKGKYQLYSVKDQIQPANFL
jgi:YVTN family beta-propeller protein